MPQGAIINQAGSKTATLSGNNIIQIEDDINITEYEIADVTIDKLVSLNDKSFYYLSAGKLYRFNFEDESSVEIKNEISIDLEKAIYYSINKDNVLIYSNNKLYTIKDDMSIDLLSEKVSDIKIQGNLLAFLNDKSEINLLDLSGSLEQSNIKIIPESGITKYSISTDGNSITYLKNQRVFTYKGNKIYPASDKESDFILSDNPNKLIVYTSDKDLIIFTISEELKLDKVFEKVSPDTIAHNQVLNYGGNCLYANANNFTIIYENGDTEVINLS